jgi:hypothetical protein
MLATACLGFPPALGLIAEIGVMMADFVRRALEQVPDPVPQDAVRLAPNRTQRSVDTSWYAVAVPVSDDALKP